MPDLNPIHYLLVGCVILLIGSLGYGKVLSMRLEASEGQFRAFVAETESRASIQIAENLKETIKRSEITRNLEKSNEIIKADRDRKYSAYRLLNSKTRSSNLPSVPISSECRKDGSEQAIVVRTVEEIEERVLEIIEQGDRGIGAAVMHEDWEEKQANVLAK